MPSRRTHGRSPPDPTTGRLSVHDLGRLRHPVNGRSRTTRARSSSAPRSASTARATCSASGSTRDRATPARTPARCGTRPGTRLATADVHQRERGRLADADVHHAGAGQSNTTYVVSYYAPNGRYSVTGGYFSGAGRDYGSHARAGRTVSTAATASTATARRRIPDQTRTATPTTGSTRSGRTGQRRHHAADGHQHAPAAPVAHGRVADSSGDHHLQRTGRPAGAQFTLKDSGRAKLDRHGVAVRRTRRRSLDTGGQAVTAGTTYTASMKIADVNGNPMPAPDHVVVHHDDNADLSVFAVQRGDSADGASRERRRATTSWACGSRTSVNGFVTGGEVLQGNRATPARTPGALWTDGRSAAGDRHVRGETATGWQTLTFTTPVAVLAGHDLRGLVHRAERPLRGGRRATSSGPR